MTDKTKAPEKETSTNTVDAAMSPPPESKPRAKRGWWRHIAGILATFVIVAAVFILLPVSQTRSPQDAAQAAWSALEKQNLAAFEEAVNTSALVQSIIEQAVVYEQTLEKGESAAAQEVRRVMRGGMIGAFRHDLSAAYTNQIREMVRTGTPPEKDEGLMVKLWQETGARKESFTGMYLTDQHEKNALVALNFKRADLGGRRLTLNLLLERSPLLPQTGWAITGVPNLAVFLLQIEEARRAILAKINAPIAAELEKAITFMDIQKSSGLDTQNPGVLWRIAYLNSSSRDIASFQIQLSVFNSDGELLKTQTLTEADPLAAGAAAEKAWPMNISLSNAAQAQILNDDLRSLRLETVVKQITYQNGYTLALYDTLPETENNKQN